MRFLLWCAYCASAAQNVAEAKLNLSGNNCDIFFSILNSARNDGKTNLLMTKQCCPKPYRQPLLIRFLMWGWYEVTEALHYEAILG